MAPAFVLNAVGLLVVATALMTLGTQREAPARRGTTMLQEIGEGLGYAARTPMIRLILGLLLTVSITVFNFTVYVPLLARQVLGLGAEGFGFLMAALGVGAVSGALTVGFRRAPEPPVGGMMVAAAVALSGLLGLSAARSVWMAVPLLFVTGFFGLILVASCNTRLQLAAPDRSARPHDEPLHAGVGRSVPHRRLLRGRDLRGGERLDGVSGPRNRGASRPRRAHPLVAAATSLIGCAGDVGGAGSTGGPETTQRQTASNPPRLGSTCRGRTVTS